MFSRVCSATTKNLHANSIVTTMDETHGITPPDVTRNEAMMSKYMEAVDQVTALIQEKNAVIDRVEAKPMQMQTINGPEKLRGYLYRNTS